MKSPVVKRSIVVAGHKTSVSLEAGFWKALREIADARQKRWWFVVKKKEADLCWNDPGFEVDISLYASLLTLVQIFIGDPPVLRARQLEKIEIDGPNHLVKSMPAWFPHSKYADETPGGPNLHR